MRRDAAFRRSAIIAVCGEQRRLTPGRRAAKMGLAVGAAAVRSHGGPRFRGLSITLNKGVQPCRTNTIITIRLRRNAVAARGATEGSAGISRRDFLAGAGVLGGMALSGLSWSALAAAPDAATAAPPRKPLVVKPVLSYDTPTRRPHTSWRNWGGIQTQAGRRRRGGPHPRRARQAASGRRFPRDGPAAGHGPQRRGTGPGQGRDRLGRRGDLLRGRRLGTVDFVAKTAKDVIFFCRHKSGPVYLWYEIISPRYLRQHTDTLKIQGTTTATW